MSDYESSYARWNDAVQKFDYYVVGVIGAGLVVLLRDLKIDRFEWSSSTVKAAGVGFLLVSFLAGLVRLERQHMLLRFENEKIKLSGYRERLKTGTTNVIKESSYQKMTAAEIDALASQVCALCWARGDDGSSERRGVSPVEFFSRGAGIRMTGAGNGAGHFSSSSLNSQARRSAATSGGWRPCSAS